MEITGELINSIEDSDDFLYSMDDTTEEFVTSLNSPEGIMNSIASEKDLSSPLQGGRSLSTPCEASGDLVYNMDQDMPDQFNQQIDKDVPDPLNGPRTLIDFINATEFEASTHNHNIKTTGQEGFQLSSQCPMNSQLIPHLPGNSQSIVVVKPSNHPPADETSIPCRQPGARSYQGTAGEGSAHQFRNDILQIFSNFYEGFLFLSKNEFQNLFQLQ